MGQGVAAGGGEISALETLSAERRADYDKRLAEIDAKLPPAPRANVKDFVNHIDYAVKLIGIDHVGISSDFDGGGGIDGWNSAAEAFNVTLELVRRGYTEEQIGKTVERQSASRLGRSGEGLPETAKETGLKAAPIRAAPVRERMNAVWGRLATCGPIANRFQASRARPAMTFNGALKERGRKIGSRIRWCAAAKLHARGFQRGKYTVIPEGNSSETNAGSIVDRIPHRGHGWL